MIEPVTMYRVRCNGCGRYAEEDSTVYGWVDEQQALLVAYDEAMYRQIDGRHYCPCCWTYDDDDEIVVRVKEPDNA